MVNLRARQKTLPNILNSKKFTLILRTFLADCDQNIIKTNEL